MSLEQLKPADQREVGVYLPYYKDSKRNYLPLAISLYKQKNLEGKRQIEGGDSIPFVASWNVSMLPADITRCRVQFDGNAELSYEVMMANNEFMNYLIGLLMEYKRKRFVDFPQAFYRKLLRLDD